MSYPQADETNLDLNYGLDIQAVLVTQHLHSMLTEHTIEDDSHCLINDAEGIDIRTQVLLNGREKGVILRVTFHGERDEDGAYEVLAEQLFNFGGARGSDDVFVMWSDVFERGEWAPPYRELTVDDLGEGAYRERRKQFREFRTGDAAYFIMKAITKLFKQAKKIERQIARERKKAEKAA